MNECFSIVKMQIRKYNESQKCVSDLSKDLFKILYYILTYNQCLTLTSVSIENYLTYSILTLWIKNINL